MGEQQIATPVESPTRNVSISNADRIHSIHIIHIIIIIKVKTPKVSSHIIIIIIIIILTMILHRIRTEGPVFCYMKLPTIVTPTFTRYINTYNIKRYLCCLVQFLCCINYSILEIGTYCIKFRIILFRPEVIKSLTCTHFTRSFH